MISIVQCVLIIILLILLTCLIWSAVSNHVELFEAKTCSQRVGCNTAMDMIMRSGGQGNEYVCLEPLKHGAAIVKTKRKHINALGKKAAQRLGGTCANIRTRKAELDNKRSELNAGKQNSITQKNSINGENNVTTTNYKANTGRTTIEEKMRKIESEIQTNRDRISKLSKYEKK